MKTSLNNIKQLEKYLEGKLDPQEALVVEARLLSNPLLKLNFFFQKKVYELVQLYHRRKLKEEVKAVQLQLFSDPAKAAFQKNSYQLFHMKNK
jgi:hypothetical protein